VRRESTKKKSNIREEKPKENKAKEEEWGVTKIWASQPQYYL